MNIVRATFRSAAVAVATLLLYLLFQAGRIVLFSLGRNTTVWRTSVVRVWARTVAVVIGLTIEFRGEPPEPPFLLVSNHLSYLDIIPYFIAAPSVFVAKNEIKGWPMLGRMAKGINIIFINRQQKRDIPRVNRLIEENITDKQGIIIFPEGTTTRGERVKRFNSSLLQYAAAREFPVSYAAITYELPRSESDKSVHEWVCWWGTMTFLAHFFKMLTLPSIRAVVTFGKEHIQHTDRKLLARRLHNHVQAQFQPVSNKKEKIYG
ncbi:MAG: lysophospholipid acyltransferase family protein [Balneolaceae bacterium]|nr:lysophospholipid acyltransferase family protein [Balneolaceae bacterium]